MPPSRPSPVSSAIVGALPEAGVRNIGTQLSALDRELYVTTEAAAAALQKHPDTLRRWRRERRFLPFVPMGGIVMYKVGDLLDFLSTRVEPDTNDA